ncbi:class I SAM-dependent methyltransferase [Halovivax limisalsi]|uniref:class I SAM-dependent methyltransferase n=1 Tax=Halovivax limisalsi TaxID=1453760 RepID=UPI001FFD9611|nr:class I SAM-dependent methyltransferase [Halovivax limisalsi]
MNRTVEEHAERFDDAAADYDGADHSPTYHDCVDLVIEHARADGATVLDIGTGTGAIALALAADADRVIGRDVSDGMLEVAREKAANRGLDAVSFANGSFVDPDCDADVDAVVSNFAMHHLTDERKRTAIETIASLEPDRVVLGDVMFFGEPDPDEPFYSPEVDDPATVGHLVDVFTDVGFAVTAAERVHDQAGVLVAERADTAGDAVGSTGTDRAPTDAATSGDADGPAGGQSP